MDLCRPVRRWFPDKESLMAVGIILVAVLLRVFALARQPLWYDELISISIATYKGGLATIWDTRFYPHPPLFVALLHFLLKGFAPSEYTVRLLPLFGGIVSLPLFYRYTADLLNKRVALMGLLLLAFSPFHIFYSQDARPYSLMFAMVVLTLYVLYRALKSNRAGWWAAHAVCLLLLLYLHFFCWLFLGGELLYMILRWRKHRRSLVPFALSLLVLPLAIPPVLQFVRDSQTAGQILVLDTVQQSISFFSTWKTLIAGEPRYADQARRNVSFLVYGFLALLGCIHLWRRQRDLLVLVVCMLAASFAFVFVFLRAIGRIVPPYEEKQFIIILPLALVLAASGVEYLYLALKSHASRILSAATAAGLLILLLTGNLVALKRYYTTFEKNIDVHVLDYLESRVEPGDLIVFNSHSMAMNFWFHWQVDTPLEFASWPLHTDGTWQFTEELRVAPVDPIQWTESLEDVLAHPRIWLISQDGFGSARLTADMLALVPPSSSEKIGPYGVYLLVP